MVAYLSGIGTTNDTVRRDTDMRIKLFLLSVGILPLLLAACSDGDDDNNITGGGGGGGTVPDSVSYATNVRPILNNSCAVSSCHGTGFVSGGLTMGNAAYNIIRTASGEHGAIISAGQSASSNLYLKVTANPPFLARMPDGRAPLSSTQIEIIKKWIDQGALDN